MTTTIAISGNMTGSLKEAFDKLDHHRNVQIALEQQNELLKAIERNLRETIKHLKAINEDMMRKGAK